MFLNHSPNGSLRRPAAGLTLLETLLAMTIVTLLAGVLAGLAAAVEQTTQQTHSIGTATQHARVVIDRIGRLVAGATSTEQYPGVVVVYQQSGSRRFADTLVVWTPASRPVDPAAVPRAHELVLVCPHPNAPQQLVELRVPGDNRSVQLNDWLNTNSGRSLINSLKQSSNRQIVVLTDLLFTARAGGSTTRSGVFFSSLGRPSPAEIAAYRNGTLAWEELSWPAGNYSSASGVRRTAISIELQLLPANLWGGPRTDAAPLPFWGSASLADVVTR